MKKNCKKCKGEIPCKINIDGKTRNLQNRKYCLKCSPFGQHNTKRLNKPKKNKQTCIRCQQEKSTAEFHKKSHTDRFHSYCKHCFSKYCVERWQKRKVEAIKAKGGRCSKCGYDKNYAALEFHHRDDEDKEMDWSKARLASEKRMLAELDKCDLVCRNCHAELHNPQGMKF